MPLPSPVGEHWTDTPVSLASGLVVTFRHGLLAESVVEEIQEAGLKRAIDRIGERDDPVTLADVAVQDLAADYFDAAMVGYYTSTDSTLVKWDPSETKVLLAEWPEGMWTDLFWKVVRFAKSGRVRDPKAD